jgi:hypothetical protein
MDYLVRAAAPIVPEQCEQFRPAPAGRRLWQVTGIGRDEKFGAALERSAAGSAADHYHLPTADLLAGLHGLNSPIAFTLSGINGRITVEIGVWTSRAEVAAADLDERANVLATVLASLYPVVHLNRSDGVPMLFPAADFVLGVPSVRPPTAQDSVVANDRIIRSMSGQAFQIVVLAQPLADDRVERLRDQVISEMRWVQEAAHAESLPSPLATDYLELLKTYLKVLGTASTMGAWRTAVYLCGDAQSLPRLESVWRSTFSGEESIPDPVRTHRESAAAEWAQRWALPQVPGAPCSTHLARPFELQTVLTSERLAAYVHLPEQEAPGFAVDAVARFDSVVTPPATSTRPPMRLGTVVHAGSITAGPVEISLEALTKHALVCGVTGSGKSTTIRHILGELADRDVPFLVIEPAKAEYRALASLPVLAGRLRVFTVGDEQTAPLRLNPLAPGPGSSVAIHLDLLKSLFSASFGLWAPLPQILERCLHQLYAEYGWDLSRNVNHRLGAGTEWDSSFPTLSELQVAVESYIDSLGYRGEVTANMRAALSTRIGGLTVGGKGQMFDTRACTDDVDLFDRPVVLELERLADEEDQAFLIGLLIIRLAEHRRSQGTSAGLRHLMVVEEAHRLLTRTQSASGDAGNPRAKAVDSFTNLLAEIRSYGQGVLIADQVPVKLASEVIKNSNLKIVHRLVADDDRTALASAMVMDERQRRALATLPAGQAAVFAEGQDAPLLVQMPAGQELATPSDADLVALRVVEHSSCRGGCRNLAPCRAARVALEEVDVPFGRLAQTLLFTSDAVARLWPDIEIVARAMVGGDQVDEALDCVIYRGAERWAQRRGAQYAWTFDTTAAIADSLADALLERDLENAVDAAVRYSNQVKAACARKTDPFPRCGEICPDQTCLHRHAVAERLKTDVLAGIHDLAWGDTTTPEQRPQRLWVRAAELAVPVIEFPSAAVTSDTWLALQQAAVAASVCGAQQALVRQRDPEAGVRVATLDSVMTVAPLHDVVPPPLKG